LQRRETKGAAWVVAQEKPHQPVAQAAHAVIEDLVLSSAPVKLLLRWRSVHVKY
jgi:hypothetical protein